MDEKELNRKIDNRIQANLKTNTQFMKRLVLIEVRNEWTRFQDDAAQRFREEARQIFEQGKFVEIIERNLKESVTKEIRLKMSEDGLQQIIRNITQEVTKDVFKGIIENVIQEVVEVTHKKLRFEHDNAKDLCYSINKDIQHLIMRNPISENSEKVILEQFMKTINEVAKQQIENMKKEELSFLKIE